MEESSKIRPRKIQLIIPVLDGAQALPLTFQRLEDFFARKEYMARVVFVDDGSTDGTLGLLEEYRHKSTFPLTVLHNTSNLGKGAAVKKGVMEVRGGADLIAFTDADLPYGLEVLDEFVRAFGSQNAASLAIGNRNLLGRDHKQYSFYRLFFKNIFQFFLPAPTRIFSDTQCGIKMFDRAIADNFERITTGNWCFDVELLLLAVKNHLRVAEVPVRIEKVHTRGGVSLFKHSYTILRDIFLIKKRDKQGQYLIK